MKPSNFTGYPWNSILQNNESEVIAQNIMKILKRTGDEFRKISFDEYKTERLKDGNFTGREEKYFTDVSVYCISPEKAEIFCNGWVNND